MWALLASTPFFNGAGRYDGSLAMVMDITARRDAEAALQRTTADLVERTKALEKQALELQETNQRTKLALDAGQMGNWELELATDTSVRSLRHDQIFGYNTLQSAWGQKEFNACVAPEDLAIADHAFKEALETGALRLECRIMWPDTSTHWIAIEGRVERDSLDHPVRILGVVREITERKNAESELMLLAQRLSLAAEAAQVGVWEWNLAADTLTWDVTMFKIYGIPPVVPMPYAKWSASVYPDDLPSVEALMRKVIDEKSQASAEFRIILPDGSVRTISVVIRVVLDGSAKAIRVLGVNVDVTEPRAMALQMAHSAEHDFLTDLPNRGLLNDRIGQAVAAAPRHMKKVAVLFLDLDGFKHINDSLGHAFGDKLLQSVARRLVKCVRACDTVSRQGGDEFVVLLSEVARPENPAITAERILKAITEGHSIDQNDVHVTASIGISVYPDDGLDAETLLKNADTAMYQAKADGRQSYKFFKSVMNVRAVERQSMEENLRRALDRQEFTLHYQPKINLSTGQISGAEALIRWTHPTLGPISPGRFIPVAEDSGLILPIGKWVLAEACRQARKWEHAGLRLPTIAANISAVQFREGNFLEGVFEILQVTGLEPKSLELELTESVLMKHAEAAESVLRALRAKGVQVAIDDFGTGYSSLSYLTKFPVDALKIDQSFVHQISNTLETTSIVIAVLSMARSLKLKVVAEGVETQEELSFLQAHHCDEAQGYYFSRPVPAEQFAKLLESDMSQKVFPLPHVSRIR
jgi:diguanylate cyclase (GGDEF)-like protein